MTPYWVTIRRNEDGAERTSPEPFGEWHKRDPKYGNACTDKTLWSEGNYVCDCNRQIYWNRLAGEPDGDPECSHYKYSVRITDKDKNVLYCDYDERDME
jgi:hypothetical protein